MLEIVGPAIPGSKIQFRGFLAAAQRFEIMVQSREADALVAVLVSSDSFSCAAKVR
jgi:hypothetical protein